MTNNNEIKLPSIDAPIVATDPRPVLFQNGQLDGTRIANQLRMQHPQGMPSSAFSRVVNECLAQEHKPEEAAYLQGIQTGMVIDTLRWNVEMQGGIK